MLISDEYKELNRELHRNSSTYGTSGHKYADRIRDLLETMELKDPIVLDYGCGKGTLKPKLKGYTVREYDPGIPGKSMLPAPADLVVCTDVLEHVEPEHIDSVLHHIDDLSMKGAFLTAATRPANKFLSDGRNAHLTVEPGHWWFEKVKAVFGEDIAWLDDDGKDSIFYMIRG